jgi:hypothetical protein
MKRRCSDPEIRSFDESRGNRTSDNVPSTRVLLHPQLFQVGRRWLDFQREMSIFVQCSAPLMDSYRGNVDVITPRF